MCFLKISSIIIHVSYEFSSLFSWKTFSFHMINCAKLIWDMCKKKMFWSFEGYERVMNILPILSVLLNYERWKRRSNINVKQLSFGIASQSLLDVDWNTNDRIVIYNVLTNYAILIYVYILYMEVAYPDVRVISSV